jgi:hypothetical protein
MTRAKKHNAASTELKRQLRLLQARSRKRDASWDPEATRKELQRLALALLVYEQPKPAAVEAPPAVRLRPEDMTDDQIYQRLFELDQAQPEEKRKWFADGTLRKQLEPQVKYIEGYPYVRPPQVPAFGLDGKQ